MDEVELVERLAAIGWRGSRDVLLGPGDDAAVLRGGWVVSTDLVVEGVHFRLDWVSPEEAGFRAGAAALSDMSAMGARPVCLLVSLAAPEAGRRAVEFQEGVARAGDRVSVPIVGGDVSRTVGPMMVDVIALGRTRNPLRRDGAGVDDELWITGEVGAAAWAVRDWREGREPPAEARRRFVEPPDRSEVSRRLAEGAHATAMIDVSDGVSIDLARLCRASGIRGVLRIEDLPVCPGLPEGLNLALGGGEDYELLFAARPGAHSDIVRIGRESATPVRRVGFFERGEGVELETADGRMRVPERLGFDHFSSPDQDR